MATFVFAISLLLVLMITSESIRRSKHAAVVIFVVYPIVMTLFFLKTEHAFFHYLKMLNVGTGGRIPEPAAYFEKPVRHTDLTAAIQAILDPDA